MKKEYKKQVFIIGTKGIPANYGGFETFIEKLTQYQQDPSIQYYVTCQMNPEEYREQRKVYKHNGAICIPIKVPRIGAARAVLYDYRALKWVMNYIQRHKIVDADIFICACRIGPFIAINKKKIANMQTKVIINPDGHEWLRAKWNRFIKWYWRFSERLCVKYADYLICDSLNIEKYIQREYERYSPKTSFIAYGSETTKSILADNDEKILSWFQKWDLAPKDYYVNIGRLVPENNYETMVREFMNSQSTKKLVLVATIGKNKFYEQLKTKLDFEKDSRIKFVDGIYDQELLKKVRENAYGYIHGHSVGGTNPSLLEALGTLDLNLLYDVGFNKEVAEEGALYWNLERGNLSTLINRADLLTEENISRLGEIAHRRIDQYYTWNYIANLYETAFRRI